MLDGLRRCQHRRLLKPYFYMKKKAAKVTLTDAAKVAEKVESTAA